MHAQTALLPDTAATLKRLSLEELLQVEVMTTSKEPRSAFRTPAALSVLTRDDIRRSGALTLPDVLRLIPGVQVSQIDSARWAVGIRGFQGALSRSVLVLIDGRSVYTPLFAGVYWEMQDVMLEDIDRIEVIRGPGATTWGANAVNGVINILTKRAQDTRGNLLSMGSGNLAQGFLSWRYGAGTDALSYRIYGKGFTRGPMHHPDGRNYDDWRMGQTGFRMDWKKSDRDTFTLQGDLYGTVAGTKVNISRLNPPSIAALEDNGHSNGQNLNGTWRRTYESGSRLRLQTYYDRTERDDLNYREVRHTFDVDLTHEIPFSRHTLIWGAGVRTSPSHYGQTVPTVDFTPHEQTYNIFSGFLEETVALSPDKFGITVGAKLQHNSFSGFEIQPTARFIWTPSAKQAVWGAVTRAVRTPSRIEDAVQVSGLTSQAPPQFFRLIGDGNFSSEKLTGYEAGARRQVTRSTLVGISAFYNRYQDLLSLESGPSFPEQSGDSSYQVLPYYIRNGIQAASSGFEVNGLWDPAGWWRLKGSYSTALIDAKSKPGSNDGSTAPQLEGNSAEHKGVAISSFDLPGNAALDVVFRVASGVPNQRVPAYATGDVRLAWRLRPDWELSLVGRNLLQPSHVEYGGNPGALVGIKRSVHINLVWGR